MNDTRTDAEQFLEAVALHTKGLETVAVGCLGPECEYAEGDPEHSCETYFSWSQCDGCGSSLGGDRSEAHGFYRDGSGALQSVEMSVCVDCMLFHANEDVPETWN